MASHYLLNKRYEILEPLGKGGMAEVFRARDIMLERSVAVKLLREDFSKDKGFQERFRQEAKAAANLSHPNIVTIHDFGIDEGTLFIVMEYLPGVNLKTMIDNLKRLKTEDAIPLLVQACAGLGYAHRAGLVHCDVKPHNMIVAPDQRLKITDFGIARVLSSIRHNEQSDTIWGSPLYFSPEQATGGAPSPASDVYSLGVVMYEMLTGQTPFQANTAEALIELHRKSTPFPPRRLNPNISPELEQIIMKTLSKEPTQRYRTADQLGRVLLSFGDTRSAPSLRLTPEANQPAPTPPPAQPAASSAPAVVSAPRAPSQPIALPPPQPTAQRVSHQTSLLVEETDREFEIDWVSVGLGLGVLIAVLGLIPFWTWIVQLYTR